jgi:hypothetical protein
VGPKRIMEGQGGGEAQGVADPPPPKKKTSPDGRETIGG